MARVAVLGDEFCVPYYTDLTVTRKPSSSTHFQVSDSNGALMFLVDNGGRFSFHTYRRMRDLGDFPIICMRKQIMSWHSRWTAHRGDTCAENNVLFSVKRSNFLQLRTQLDVFLATNVNERTRDFHLKKNSNQAFLVYRGNDVIAEINCISNTWGGSYVGKEVFNLRVYPDVDYAFIVALFVILYEIAYTSNHSSSSHNHNHHLHHHAHHHATHHNHHLHHHAHHHAHHHTTHHLHHHDGGAHHSHIGHSAATHCHI